MITAAAPRKRTRTFGKHAWLSVLGGLVVTIAMSVVAEAYWTASGTGSGSSPVGTLAAPTLSGTAGAGTVDLSWTAAGRPSGASGDVYYYVNGAHAGCPMSQAAATTATLCTDSGLAAGTLYNYTVTAVWQSWTATSSPATQVTTLAYGAASKLAFTRSPGDTTAGNAFASQPQVTVQDQYGNTVTTDASAVTIAVTGGTATVTSCTSNPQTASSGIATFGGCTITKAGTYTLTATDGALTSATTGTFTISASTTASKLAFTQSPSGDTIAGVAFASQPQVTVQDQYGNTVTTDTSSVTIAVTGGTPAVTCTANTKAASGGIATFSGCTITKAGTGYQLHATDGTLTPADSAAFNITPGAASKLSFTQSPGNTSADNALSPQPQVTVQDQYGNTVTTDSSTVTLAIKTPTPTSGGPGSLSGCTPSGLNGVITFSGCKITTVGTGYQLHATDGSLTAADSTAFNITVGAASQLAFTAQPTNTAGGAAITPAVTVTVQDAGGNTVTSSTASVIIAIGTNPGPGTLSGTTSVSAVAGVATFSDLSINTPATGYTLTAASSGLAGAVSSTFNVSGAAVSFTIPTPGAQTAGTAFSVSITAKDINGNTAIGYTGSKCLTFSGPVASPWGGPKGNGTAPSYPAPAGSCAASAVTFTDGVAATVTLTLYNALPSTILTATDGSLTPAVSGSTTFTVSAAAETGIGLSSPIPITNNTSPPVSCSYSSASSAFDCSSTGEQVNGGSSGNVLVAKLALEDPFGNPVSNSSGSSIVIDLAISGNGTLDGVTPPATKQLSIVDGYSAPFTLTRDNGNKTVTMTAKLNGTTQTLLTVTLSF